MSDVTLKLDWCSHEAAKYAVEKWHYSHTMPKSKLAKIGAWENGVFIGCVIFGVGATADLVKSYGLIPTQGCELVRVALNKHVSATSKIVSIALKMIKREYKGLRLVVSFADPEQSHVGTIYQAMGWIFTGVSAASDEYLVNGKRWHGRAFRASMPSHLTTKQALLQMDANYQIVKGTSKYRYLYPLDDAMRAQIAPLSKPYPKRSDPMRLSSSSKTAIDQIENSGANPTQTLNTPSANTHEISF